MDITDSDLANALEHSPGALVITDTHGVIVYANTQFTKTTGYTQEDVLGKATSILSSKKTPRSIYEDMWKTLQKGNVWSGRILNTRKSSLPMRIAGGDPKVNANEYWAQLTITPIRNSEGEVYLYAASHQDLSVQIKIEKFFDFERRGAQVRAQIASILQSTKPLQYRLIKSLGILTSLDELSIENKCGIFVANEEQTHLDLIALHGEFSQEFRKKEERIPFGNCLCGRVAQTGKIMISDDCFCDDRHDNIFSDMTSHGHYIIPLRIKEHNIGILFLYTEPYPSRNQPRLDMLHDVGHLIAQAILNDQTDQKLIYATHAANASSQAKSDFLASMSHEIRTPLNGILGYTEMLQRDDKRTTPEERDEWLGIIQSSGQHLLQLINNILDLSKVESSEFNLDFMPCDPAQILFDLASVMRIHAKEKMLDLNVEMVGSLPRSITSDPTRLRQIMTNLIGNAIKFTESGSVTLKAQLVEMDSQNAGLKIDVIDTGTGIPDDKLETIFDPFSQADSSIVRNFGGTGLGLTISRKISKALGGSLNVISLVGDGSTFTVILPLGSLVDLELHDDFKDNSNNNPSSTSKPLLVNQLDGHVLVVDDGDTNRKLISLILKRAGAKVTTAENGKEGFDLASNTNFDLILMDMQMPVMDGYTATTKLREQGTTTPIIALTASAMTGDRERCIDAGCSSYLTKPINIDDLLKHASKWMDSSHSKSNVLQNPNKQPEATAGAGDAILPDLPMDDAELRTIVLNYIDTIPHQIAQIEQAWNDKDMAIIAGVTHKLIGSGGTVGLDPLTEAAVVVEQSMETEELDKIGSSIADLRSVIDRILQGADQMRVDA